MTIVFLNQYYLVQKEVITALRTLSNLKFVTLDICSHPTEKQAELACEILKKQQCAILFTINEWGLDTEGIIHNFILKKNILHLNWCVDDPFFEELILKKKFIRSPCRMDFVSDRDYLEIMKSQGYQAHFLPIATDPAIFFPSNNHLLHDVCFVGSSYHTQIQEFSSLQENFLQSFLPNIKSVLDLFHLHNDIDMEKLLLQKISACPLKPDFNQSKALFICKHLTGYLYRKEIIMKLSESFQKFTVYGDNGWKTCLKTKLNETVSYGEDLRKVYSGTKVNIDINRVVIRNGFTQRVFDVLACKSFLITSAKPIICEFFETSNNPEIVVFRNTDELIDLTNYYLNHENQRNIIAKRGYTRVLSSHTYKHRIQQLFSIVSQNMFTIKKPVI